MTDKVYAHGSVIQMSGMNHVVGIMASEQQANDVVRIINAYDDLAKALRDVLSNSNRGTFGRLIIDILQEQYLENLLAKMEPA